MKTQAGRSVRAFSLIEMMVVLVVLAIVLSIVLPMLSGMRNEARKVATRATLTELGSASTKFQLDERRLPGYFSAKEMGSQENETQFGFSGMENILLDLAGGIVSSASATTLQVGPTAQTVFVEPSLIGATTQTAGVVNKGYFHPDAKYFIVQNVPGQKGGTVRPDHLQMPDLVDSFRQPFLAWSQDQVPATGSQFAAENSQSVRAKFYWAENSVFTTATALGSDATDQANGSLLAAFVNGTLEGVLGHPSFPDPADATKPFKARGEIVFQSAGVNGVFVGKTERGGRLAAGAGNVIRYNTAADPMEGGAFDDILGKVGN